MLRFFSIYNDCKAAEFFYTNQPDKDWYFAILTFTFVYLPSPMMIHVVLDRATASCLNIMWGTILAMAACIVLTTHNFHPNHDDFFSFLAMVNLTLGLFMIIFGLATVSHLALFTKGVSFGQKRRKISKIILSGKFFVFPLLIFLSPSINLLTKFRAIFPHNKFVLTQRKTGSMALSIFQSSTQFVLQVYIVFNDDASPCYYQWMSMILSTIIMAFPETDKFITSVQSYSFFSVIKYLPVLVTNILFRALTCSVLFTFLGFFYGVTFTVLRGVSVALMGVLTAKCCRPGITKEENFKSLVGEMAVLHYLTISCLKDTPAARFLRKFSFYASLLFNSTLILTILLLCNLKLEIKFVCRPIFQDCDIDWQKLRLVKDIEYLNIVLCSVILIGFLSLILDLIYSKLARPVFNVSVS